MQDFGVRLHKMSCLDEYGLKKVSGWVMALDGAFVEKRELSLLPGRLLELWSEQVCENAEVVLPASRVVRQGVGSEVLQSIRKASVEQP